MRISDWSSDVCSSDLGALDGAVLGLLERPAPVFALDLFALGGAVAPEGGEGALPGVEVDGADPEAELHQPDGQVDRRGGLSGAALLAADHDDVGHRLFRPMAVALHRSEEHTSELQSLMRTSYAVFCLKKNTHRHTDKI